MKTEAIYLPERDTRRMMFKAAAITLVCTLLVLILAQCNGVLRTATPDERARCLAHQIVYHGRFPSPKWAPPPKPPFRNSRMQPNPARQRNASKPSTL